MSPDMETIPPRGSSLVIHRVAQPKSHGQCPFPVGEPPTSAMGRFNDRVLVILDVCGKSNDRIGPRLRQMLKDGGIDPVDFIARGYTTCRYYERRTKCRGAPGEDCASCPKHVT